MAITVFAMASLVRAANIVDTGPGPGSVPGWSLGLGVDSLAGEFTLSSTQQVSAVYGWIGDDYIPQPGNNTPGENDTGGQLDVSILSGGVNANNVIYTGSVDITLGSAPNWYGPSGLNLTLGPGDYWVEFSGDVAYNQPGGFLGYMPFYVPNPLEAYAYDTSGGPGDFSPDFLGFGVQVAGANSVPDDSSTAVLLGLGIVGAALVVRSRRLLA